MERVFFKLRNPKSLLMQPIMVDIDQPVFEFEVPGFAM